MRRGYGNSGGIVNPGVGCNFINFGLEDAQDIQATIEYMVKQPYVDANSILILGQSGGGMASFALASKKSAGLKGIINFAGGLHLHDDPCWEHEMVSAFKSYAKTTSVPSLWVYSDNDSFFSPAIVKRAHEAYLKAGGKAKLVQAAAIKQDGHNFFYEPEGMKIWLPEVDKFLSEIGLGNHTLAKQY